MMDFQRELEKFKPCLDVEKVQDKSVNADEIQDLMDILKTMQSPKKGDQA